MNNLTTQQIFNELIARLECSDNGVSLESMETLRDLLIDDIGIIEWTAKGCPTD
jgi:hypothetical protein